MEDDEKKSGKFGGTPKIRPRNIDKPAEAGNGEGDDAGSKGEGSTKHGPLLKRSDPGWLAKLSRLSPTERRERGRHRSDHIGIEAAPPQPPTPPLPSDEAHAEETDEAAEGDDAQSGEGTRRGYSRRRRRKKKDTAAGSVRRFWRGGGALALRFLPHMLLALLAGLVAYGWGEAAGRARERDAIAREETVAEARRITILPPEVATRLEAALASLRSLDATSALITIEAITADFPDVPSLNYLAALAAAQAGQFDKAAGHAKASIKKGQRVSDSLVILSIVESQKAMLPEHERMGDPHVNARKFIEEAIAADPANPGPRMEMGSLLRYLNDREAAVREFRAAQNRFHPVDSHMAADVTIALIEVEQLPAEALQAGEPASGDVRALFPAAYVAMRQDNFPLAVKLLERCKAMLSPDLFLYLMNDPAFRRFAYRDEVKRLAGE